MMQELINKVKTWAFEKGLIFPDNSKNQYIKCVEEVGEVGDAILKDDLDKIRTEIGDVVVTLIVLSSNYDLSLSECLESAYDKIKSRKGKTIKGTFIKEEDL